MLAAEERELAAAPKVKATGQTKKAVKKEKAVEQFSLDSRADVPEFSASGLDAALDLLDVAAAGSEVKSGDKIERHPEKRQKSAWAAFEV